MAVPISAIVIPCFNEESRLSWDQFTRFVESHKNFHFLFVNDGSTDNTAGILASFQKHSPQCSYINLSQNKGKAEAVRQGMLKAYSLGFTHLGYLDADLTISLETAKQMLLTLAEKNLEFIFASRTQRFDNKQSQNLPRQTIGYIFSRISTSALKLPDQDTQCAAKFFKASIVPVLFREQFLSRWIFDVEIFFRFKSHFQELVQNHYFEFPLLHWDDNASSKIKFLDYLKVPFQIIKISIQYRFLKKLTVE